MDKYYEIYPMERWAEKISNGLDQVLEVRPGMYKKTKQRYENLAECLIQSAEKIAIILESDSLRSKNTDEFNELETSDESEVSAYQRIMKKLENVRDISDLEHSFSSGNVHYSRSSGENLFVKTFEAIDYFDSVLSEASMYNFGYTEVNQCAEMLYYWFHTRFKPEVPDSTFKYNIQYLPEWICNFIILYGKYNHTDSNDQFVKLIDKWCTTVINGSCGNYAIPYEVYQLNKDKDPSDYTIDSVVISDLLMNGMLYKLSRDSCSCMIYLDPSLLIQIVKENNPSLHSQIVTRIAHRKELIEKIGLTPIGGSDE